MSNSVLEKPPSPKIGPCAAYANKESPSKAAVKPEDDQEGKDEVLSQEEFITLPSPKPFTRAIADSIEYRPAALLIICDFLNKLSAKCKEDLHRLGILRYHQQTSKPNLSQPKSNVSTANSKSAHRHHHHHKESWEKRMLRLKVYQRAFSSIVMYFKAYCPALFYIKKSYEDMLCYRINQIKQAHFEKKRLQILKHHMKVKIQEYVFPEYYQLLKSEKYLTILRQRISLQEEAIKVITEILKKMEEALSDHFERHRDLEEQIVMVDTEIANRRQKAFSMREKEEREVKEKRADNAANADNAPVTVVDSDEEDKEDPFYNLTEDEIDEERRMVWIMAFAICHKDLEDAEKKLTMYQTKYQFVVPRHEHESMKRSIIDEKSSAKVLADEKDTLEEELTNLKDYEAKLTEELAEVKVQLTELRTTVTPRPSWEQLGEFVQGGVPKWISMIRGKSTKDAADKLFNELRSRRGGDKFLQPLGTEHTVLRCLRHGKKVSDRQLHSRDAALVIHDIWLTRKKVLEENLNAPKHQDEFDYGKQENKATKSFADFVAIYFEEQYEDVEQRMEWTYNLVECCKRFSLDYRLTDFLNVLQGRSDEGVYTVIRNELFRVRNTFLEKSVDEGMNEGILSSNQYVEALETTFPNKAEPEVQSIARVTNKMNAELNPGEDADLSVYHVTQLIDVRDDGFRGRLVDELVKQFDVERQHFIDQIVEKLANLLDISPQSAMSETDPAANRDVSVTQVYSSIKRADGDLDDEKVGAALAWIFTNTSVVPGGGITTSRLVNYARLHSGEDREETSTVSLVPTSADLGQVDDEKFERAIKDILRTDEEEEKEGEQQMSEAQKKSFYRALKTAKLRTVVKRLRGSALVPSWLAYNPQESLLPETTVDLEADLAVVKKYYEETKAPPPPPEVPRLSGDEMAGEGIRLSIDSTGEAGTAPPAAPTPAAPAPPSAVPSEAETAAAPAPPAATENPS